MSDRRKACDACEGMSVHSEQVRSYRSEPVHPTFSLLLPRPRSCQDSRFSSRIPAPQALQVQGCGCSIQQRAHSGRVTDRVPPQSRGAGDGRLTLLSRVRRTVRSRTEERASRADVTLKGGGPEVSGGRMGAPRDAVHETAGFSTVRCSNERQVHHMQPGTLSVAELHLYLPSTGCESEEPSSDAEEMRGTER